MYDLGFDIGVSWEPSQDALKICDTSADARILVVLTSDQMNELGAYWHDGCCPVCLTEIPLYDVICDECLDRAKDARIWRPLPV